MPETSHRLAPSAVAAIENVVDMKKLNEAIKSQHLSAEVMLCGEMLCYSAFPFSCDAMMRPSLFPAYDVWRI